MKALLAIFFSAAAALTVAASPFIRLEQEIQDGLFRRGLHQGYDPDSETFIAIAGATAKLEHQRTTPEAMLALHARLVDEALANARREIETSMAGIIDAYNSTSRERKDGKSSKAGVAGYSTSASLFRAGFETLDFRTAVSDGVYCVCVAMAWSEDREAAAVASLNGSACAAADWKGELRSRFAGRRYEELPPYGMLLDSDGFAHFYCVQTARLDGASNLKRNYLFKNMETRAAARLQLVSDGSAYASDATQIGTASSSDGQKASHKAHERQMDASSVGTRRRFETIYEGSVQSFCDPSGVFAAVYVYTPQHVAAPAENDTSSARRRVKLWNPVTQRYE